LDPISTNLELGLDIGPIHFHTELEACQSIRSKDIDRTSSLKLPSLHYFFYMLTSVTLKSRSNQKPTQYVQECGEMHPPTSYGDPRNGRQSAILDPNSTNLELG
jgi:hypothetical protein